MARHSPRRHRCLALSGALGLGLLPCLGLLVPCGGAGAPAPDAPVSLEVTPTSPDMVPASDHGYDLFGPGPDTFRVSARDAAGSPFPGTTFQARVVPGDVARVLRLPDGLGNSFRLEPLETGRAATLPEPPFLNATVPTGPPIRLASIHYSCQPALPDSSRSPSMPKAPSGSMPGPGTPSTPSPPRQRRAPSRYPTYLAACVWWAWACCRSRPFRSGSRLQLPAGGHWHANESSVVIQAPTDPGVFGTIQAIVTGSDGKQVMAAFTLATFGSRQLLLAIGFRGEPWQIPVTEICDIAVMP